MVGINIFYVYYRPTKISKHPTATRFFKPDSFVKDWYRGQLTNALSCISKEEVSFVMYYAPWDAESQYVRHEFEKAALILKDRVSFHYSGVIVDNLLQQSQLIIVCLTLAARCCK